MAGSRGGGGGRDCQWEGRSKVKDWGVSANGHHND